MKQHTPTLQVEEICSVLTKTLRGEITWSEEREWVVKPVSKYVDAHGYIGKDREGRKSFVLVRKYTDKVLGAINNFWPVLFVINGRRTSPEACITALCSKKETPSGSRCYDGHDNKVFNKLIQAIQLVAE